MTRLSVLEFKEICDYLSPHRYIFTTENQEWYSFYFNAIAEIAFEVMLITHSLDAVYLKNNNGFFRLNRIKYIEMHDKKTTVGDVVFRIVCGSIFDNSQDIAYTIIAQK